MTRRGKSTIWQSRMARKPSERHLAYCAGWDVVERPMADEILVPYDIWVNQAHALMLFETGIIDDEAHRKIQRALAAIEHANRAGRWKLDPALEDVHINIEREVSRRAGEDAGGRLHTGRSRNDQTATDVRLYTRDALLDFQADLLGLASELIRLGRAHAESLMPGLSHTQPSCVSTLGHLLCAHAQAFLRDAGQMCSTYAAINLSPLGAAAGHGTSWPINRRSAARYLGFDDIQENSIDCVSSRWEMEARLAADLAFAANHLAQLAQDLILLSQPWVGFIAFDDRHVTGSSIMPQKRNPDFAEVTRAKAAVVQGVLQSLLALNKGMVSGYNRDSQWSKYLIMEAVEELRDAPSIIAEALGAATVHTDKMAEAAGGHFLVAVDLADTIAREGDLPFREAYEVVARLVRECESDGRFTAEKVERVLAEKGLSGKIAPSKWRAAIEPQRALRGKKSPGGAAPSAVRANLKRLDSAARSLLRWNRNRRNAVERARRKMLERIESATRPGAKKRSEV